MKGLFRTGCLVTRPTYMTGSWGGGIWKSLGLKGDQAPAPLTKVPGHVLCCSSLADLLSLRVRAAARTSDDDDDVCMLVFWTIDIQTKFWKFLMAVEISN